MAAQVALKRQQAAEDAIALGLRAIAGENSGLGYLPPGPVWGSLNGGNGGNGNNAGGNNNENPDPESDQKRLRVGDSSLQQSALCSDDDEEDEDMDEDVVDTDSLPDQTETKDNISRDKTAASTEEGSKNRRPKSKSKASNSNGFDTPTDYRPGRLSHVEILHRLFPQQRKEVLELVLQGCNGDVVKAIEHFLCANEAAARRPQIPSDHTVTAAVASSADQPAATPTSTTVAATSEKSTEQKSAFVPLPMPMGLISNHPPMAFFAHHPFLNSFADLRGNGTNYFHASQQQQLAALSQHGPYHQNHNHQQQYAACNKAAAAMAAFPFCWSTGARPPTASMPTPFSFGFSPTDTSTPRGQGLRFNIASLVNGGGDAVQEDRDDSSRSDKSVSPSNSNDD